MSEHDWDDDAEDRCAEDGYDHDEDADADDDAYYAAEGYDSLLPATSGLYIWHGDTCYWLGDAVVDDSVAARMEAGCFLTWMAFIRWIERKIAEDCRGS